MNLANVSHPIEPANDDGGTEMMAALRRPPRPAGEGRMANHLWHRVARECEAMAENLFAAGRPIPPDLVALLAEALSILDYPGSVAATGAMPANSDSADALAGDRDAALDPAAISTLTKVHAELAAILAPTTPEAILLLTEERRRHSPYYILGPLPIVRQMLGLALMSLFVMLGVSLFPDINPTTMSKTFLELTGYPLLEIEILLLSSASLGSCFQNLQQMNAYLSAGTYDPRFQSTYWTRWVMGMISGFVLAQLVHDTFLVPGTTTGATQNLSVIGEHLLALLGGYSVDMVHGILSQLVNKLGSVFQTAPQTPVEKPTSGRPGGTPLP
jgi:hypothetical protein